MRTNNLNDVMQFDHVVSILPGGNVTDGPEGIYAPELHMDSTDNGDILPEHEAQYVADALSQGWTLESGWTGQYSYSGVCMHDSEYIGGWLAEHILCTPGLWVAAPVRMLLDVEGEGWVLAYRPMVRPSGAYRCPCCGDDFMGTAYICDECDASGCEQTIDSTGDVGFWECSREDVTEEDDDPEDDGRRFSCADCLRTDVKAHERIQTHGGFVCTSCQEREGYVDIGNV